MRYSARSLAAGAAALTISFGLAQAAEGTAPGKMGVGVGVICNTTEQAKDYVNRRLRGAELKLAVDAVNEGAQDPRACGFAAVAFARDRTLETANLQGKLVSIVRIHVLAGFNGRQWMRVPAMVQYAIIEAEGIAI